jgi:transcriptional regulator of arginine metabolism
MGVAGVILCGEPWFHMTQKGERQSLIRDIVESRRVASQEELRRLLRQRGWDVTQSTLSRDLHEMGLARIPTGEGARYAFPESVEAGIEEGADLASVLPPLYRKIDAVGQFIVVKTIVGGAQPVGVALDAKDLPEVVGTIAGDDTILIICRSRAARERMVRLLKKLATRGRG